MRFAVMGAGATGGYLAARLATAGYDVACIARGAHLDALRTHGLTLKSPLGDARVPKIAAVADPAALAPVDAVLFTVKLYDAAAAARALLPLLTPDTPVITFQNGVAGPEIVAAAVGAARTVAGSASIPGVAVTAPGVVEHISTKARFVFGRSDGRADPVLERIAQVFRSAAIEAEVSRCISTELWQKFVLLAATGGVATAARATIGALAGDPDVMALAGAAMREAEAVARARGVELPADIVAASLASLANLPPAQKPSMLHDLEAGRRLEVAWLSGALVAMGREAGVPTPTHAAL
jgi:2-dehydropantoate 2-reductase